MANKKTNKGGVRKGTEIPFLEVSTKTPGWYTAKELRDRALVLLNREEGEAQIPRKINDFFSVHWKSINPATLTKEQGDQLAKQLIADLESGVADEVILSNANGVLEKFATAAAEAAKVAAELLTKQQKAAKTLFDGLPEKLKKEAGGEGKFIDAVVKAMGDKSELGKGAKEAIEKAIGTGGDKLHENIAAAVKGSIAKSAEEIGFFAKHFVSPFSGDIGRTWADAWKEHKGVAFGKGVVTIGGIAAAAKGISDWGKPDEQGETHDGVAALEVGGGAAAALAGLVFKREGLRV